MSDIVNSSSRDAYNLLIHHEDMELIQKEEYKIPFYIYLNLVITRLSLA